MLRGGAQDLQKRSAGGVEPVAAAPARPADTRPLDDLLNFIEAGGLGGGCDSAGGGKSKPRAKPKARPKQAAPAGGHAAGSAGNAVEGAIQGQGFRALGPRRGSASRAPAGARCRRCALGPVQTGSLETLTLPWLQESVRRPSDQMHQQPMARPMGQSRMAARGPVPVARPGRPGRARGPGRQGPWETAAPVTAARRARRTSGTRARRRQRRQTWARFLETGTPMRRSSARGWTWTGWCALHRQTSCLRSLAAFLEGLLHRSSGWCRRIPNVAATISCPIAAFALSCWGMVCSTHGWHLQVRISLEARISTRV